MSLVGKSREEIEAAVRNKGRAELIDVIYDLATFEPMFGVTEIAKRRRLGRHKILQLIHDGVLKAHKPIENAMRVPLSSIKHWDAQTALALEKD